MAKAKKDTQLFINGITHLILEGTEYSDSSDIVKNNKDLFIIDAAPAKKSQAKKTPKKEEIKLEEVVEEPKEELLIEEPVQALEVTEEVVEVTEEVVEETKPKRKRSKK